MTIETVCKKQYKEIWDKLDDKSKIFIITSQYIYRLIQSSVDDDYSPVIIEICRAYENELLSKVFDRYICKAATCALLKEDMTIKQDYLYDVIVKAKSKKTFFISMMNMVNILYDMRLHLIRGTYRYDLKQTLARGNWDVSKLSDKDFYLNGKKYTLDLRDESAHPNIMKKKQADECLTLTPELITHFLRCNQA